MNGDIRVLPSQEYLLDCFEHIGPHLIWLERPEEHFEIYRVFLTWNRRFAGMIAGSRSPQGYIDTTINNITYKAHRLIYKLHTGLEPEEIDHVNRIRHDNRFENLRSVTRLQNARNMGMSKRNSTGCKGVYNTERGWIAQGRINSKTIHIGVYQTYNDAVQAKKEWDAL